MPGAPGGPFPPARRSPFAAITRTSSYTASDHSARHLSAIGPGMAEVSTPGPPLTALTGPVGPLSCAAGGNPPTHRPPMFFRILDLWTPTRWGTMSAQQKLTRGPPHRLANQVSWSPGRWVPETAHSLSGSVHTAHRQCARSPALSVSPTQRRQSGLCRDSEFEATGPHRCGPAAVPTSTGDEFSGRYLLSEHEPMLRESTHRPHRRSLLPPRKCAPISRK